MARRILAGILYFGSGAALLIAAAHIALGNASIIGAGPVNATVDGEDRFFGVIFGGYGLALWYGARDVVARVALIRFLAALFLAGAFARAMSWFFVGPPHAFFKAMLALETILPFIIWALQASVSGSSPRRRFKTNT